MIISLVLTLLVTASGTVATYLYDEGASLATRVCTGACIGIAALGLVGFVVAIDHDVQHVAEPKQAVSLATFFLLARLLAVFRLVHAGSEHEDMRFPPYGGSLFDPDRFPFLTARTERGTQSMARSSSRMLPLMRAIAYVSNL